MRSKWFFLLVATLATASLWGCGSNGGSGGSAVTPTDSQPQAVGSDSCAVCHTTVVAMGWDGSAHDTDAAGCEGCHGNGGAHRGVGPIPYPSPTLEDQCAACHTDEGFLARHAGDDPATATVIEGYVMRDFEPEGCRDCHNPHNVGEANAQWAQSAHAGRIATDAPDTETVWGHYDWDSASRASCARCHTTTGIMNFLSGPGSYAAANNDFSHLEAGQNELLYCWGCHSDAGTGALRNPGAIIESYAAATAGAAPAIVSYPDVAASNVCMGCHLGREVGQNVKNDTDPDGVRSFINSHYLAAGGMVFNEAGYEYDVYTNYGYHQNVGVGNAQNTGTAGPCVTCHMSSAEPHKFDVVEKDANGAITAVTSTTCANCHAGLTPAALESTKEEFHHALVELEEALAEVGIYYYGAHPYFYSAPYVVGGTNTAFTDWAGVYGLAAWKVVMGAAFNYNLIHHDPGAYAHNAEYSLQLIADSIDFISDGVLDGDSSEAAILLGRGVNVGAEAGYATIHDGVSPSALNCSQCHSEAPHYGGYAAASDGSVSGKGQYAFVGVTCGECHANTATNLEILPQYAESGHGDVMGDGWVHYNWKLASRAGCARCHTSLGYKAASLNWNAPTPPYTAIDENNPAEVLSCGACHTDVASGALRNPGAVTPKTTANPPVTLVKKADPDDVATPVSTLPDSGASNVCYYCHAGGGNMFSNWSSTRVASHHAVAAGTLNSDVTRLGYEFVTAALAPDTVYLSYASSPHKSLGGATAGPCVSCHMADSNHRFDAVDEATQTISAQTLCNTCHGSLTYASLEEEKAGYDAAGVLLAAYINNTLPNYKNAIVTGTVTAHNDRAAWYNFKVFPAEEQGGFVHNPRYVKQLIFDSIDWLQDGVLNGTISTNGIDAATYGTGLHWLGTARP